MRPIDADTLFNNMEAAFWYSNNDRDEIAEKLVLEAPTVNGWTSVKDGLPKENGKYLVISDSPICRRILIASFAKNLEKVDMYAFQFRGKKRPGWYEYDCDWGYIEYDNVTHWLPLPEMPEGE